MRTVHVVLPAGVDDRARPSGGNTYDLRVCRELTSRGWGVVRHDIVGDWPRTGEPGRLGVRRVLDALPDGSVVVVDGLVGSAVGDLLMASADRLQLVLLVHLPLGVDAPAGDSAGTSERQAVAGACTVVVTSAWTRGWLLTHTTADPGRVVVALPGVDPAPLTVPLPGGSRMLTVGALTVVKGHDRVLAALNDVRGLDWTWTCVGSAAVDPAYAEGLSAEVAGRGLGDRVRLVGPLGPEELADAYAGCDLLVVGSRRETYGMAVTEALARGVPALVTPVGGVSEALGTTDSGVPGMVAAAEDVGGLADALRTWLTDADLRERLRASARARRHDLPTWSATADIIETALADALVGETGRCP